MRLGASMGFSGRTSCSTSSSTSSAPASLTRCEMTFCVETCPSPMAANTASAFGKLRSSATPTSASGVSNVLTGRLRLRIARVSSSRPSSMASVRRSLQNHWRILLRAFGLLTKLSQSRDGPAGVGFRRQNLDGVAIIERGVERHQTTVDARAHRTVAHFGVHGVREVDRRGVSGQGDDLALRREHVHFGRAEVFLERAQELVGIRGFAGPVGELLNPFEVIRPRESS